MVAFSSHVRMCGEGSTIHTPPTLFFFKWRSTCAHRFHSKGQDQSTVAQRAEMTMAQCSMTISRLARFLDWFPHYAWTDSIVSQLRLREMCVCVFMYELQPARLAE